jgi:hypothetical protein
LLAGHQDPFLPFGGLILFLSRASVSNVTDRMATCGHNGDVLNMKITFIFISGELVPYIIRRLSFALVSILFLLVALAASALAAPGAPSVPQAAAQPAEPGAIQDNSFLMEEAYNQEYGVVQHISSFVRMWNSKDWTYAFTQEWPGLHNPKHQFSYTMLATSLGAFRGSGAGLGDLALNYRYQLVGSGDTRVAFAPRLTALVPSGDSRFGRGFGGAGVQVNLPMSVVVNKRLVTHWNAGTTLVPRARNEVGERAFATGYNLGQSMIFLAHPRFNVMLETVWSGSESVMAPDRTQRAHNLFMSPGIRWAHNFASGLQIVPGVAVPIGVGPSAGEKGLVLYLSFEHPFKREPK